MPGVIGLLFFCSGGKAAGGSSFVLCSVFNEWTWKTMVWIWKDRNVVHDGLLVATMGKG